MNPRFRLSFFFACFLFFGLFSCTKDSACLTANRHIANEDLVYDSYGLHLKFSLEEALTKGISKNEYLSTSHSLEEITEALDKVATKAEEDVVAYGLLRISVDNQNNGNLSSYPVPLEGYDALRIISQFTVPHTDGTSMVIVDDPNPLDIYYHVGSGMTIKNYGSFGSPVSLSYAYDKTLTGDQTATMVYAIVGVAL